ncbi:MAG TPA: helix-hairpin-helix domain-containing protein [Methylomirabilota bacterium]|nr:helix-hairpin-helix domain-containing protein [Methylomirabilota bacterium]
MSSKRSPIAREEDLRKTDDFKLITGIGPTIESRLNSVGIFTFAQLAAMSPADLAAAVTGIVGLTAERISKQDWIGKAQELDAKSIIPEPNWIEEARQQSPNSPQRSKSTTMVQSVVEPSPPNIINTALSGMLELSNLEITLSDTKIRHSILTIGQPFGISLMLDFTGITIPKKALLQYTAIINGKRLDSHIYQILGEGYGTITLGDKVTINVDCTAPSVGIYHLEAAVTIVQQNSESTDLHALIRGGLFLVH